MVVGKIIKDLRLVDTRWRDDLTRFKLTDNRTKGKMNIEYCRAVYI